MKGIIFIKKFFAAFFVVTIVLSISLLAVSASTTFNVVRVDVEAQTNSGGCKKTARIKKRLQSFQKEGMQSFFVI